MGGLISLYGQESVCADSLVRAVLPQEIALIIHTEYTNIQTDHSTLRMFVASPTAPGRYPGILFYSDIFQLSGPMLRACARLAGYGFVVAAPEIYHRLEPPGTVIPFDDEGKTRGLEDAGKTTTAEFDQDCRAVLDYLKTHAQVSRAGGEAQLGAAGFCIGGHLAFRAALQPDVRATVCFYGTGIHDGRLGKDVDAGSLARAESIKGELLMIFGEQDPHVPAEGRDKVRAALDASGTRYTWSLYPAEHAFMRDEGARFDPEATDGAFAEMVRFFRRILVL